MREFAVQTTLKMLFLFLLAYIFSFFSFYLPKILQFLIAVINEVKDLTYRSCYKLLYSPYKILKPFHFHNSHFIQLYINLQAQSQTSQRHFCMGAVSLKDFVYIKNYTQCKAGSETKSKQKHPQIVLLFDLHYLL